MSNYNDNKDYIYNYASYHYNNINQTGKRLPAEDDEVQNFGTRPVFNKTLIYRYIFFTQAGQ